MVVNGVGGASGDQDTENTELMAIYTKDVQGAEKVTTTECEYTLWHILWLIKMTDGQMLHALTCM